MLTETVIIFSVLLGLLILISVLGGSILPVENFADEVVIDEDEAPADEPRVSRPGPAQAAPDQMSAKEMEELAMSLAALPSDEERAKVMEPMSDDVKKVLKILLKGMDAGSHESAKEGFSVADKKTKKEGFTAMVKKTKDPVAMSKKEGFTAMAKKTKEASMMPVKEAFTAMANKERKDHFSDGMPGAAATPVEPFDGDVYAMY